jgi:hypothetical protein
MTSTVDGDDEDDDDAEVDDAAIHVLSMAGS